MSKKSKDPEGAEPQIEPLSDDALDEVQGGGRFAALRGVADVSVNLGQKGATLGLDAGGLDAGRTFNTADSGALGGVSKGIKGIDRLKR